MITTIEEAQYELQVAIEETVADQGLEHGDEIAADMVSAIAWQIEDLDVARELCRRELGYIPFDLEGRLGARDYLES